MKREQPYYRKFARAGGIQRQTLYFGKDHLLVADGTYAETYRRFYFRDIEAVQIMNTWSFYWGLGFLAVLDLLVMILLIGFWNRPDEMEAAYFTLPFLGLALAATGLHVWQGPSATVRLQTAVQNLGLTCIARRKKALRFLKELRARIEPLQGVYDPAKMARYLAWLERPPLQGMTPPPFPPARVAAMTPPRAGELSGATAPAEPGVAAGPAPEGSAPPPLPPG